MGEKRAWGAPQVHKTMPEFKAAVEKDAETAQIKQDVEAFATKCVVRRACVCVCVRACVRMCVRVCMSVHS